MQVRLALLKHLPEIIRESVKPMENIDDIKILQVSGLKATGVVLYQVKQLKIPKPLIGCEWRLRYRSQAPLIDSLMSELGLRGGDINGLTQLKPKAE